MKANAKESAALHYAAMGLRVFPVARGSKGSTINGKSGQLLRSWKDEATTNADTIRGWWAMWPDADVCIATGGGLVVIDLDIKDYVDGTRELLGWCAQNGMLPATAVAKTRSGGQHHYYFVQGSYPNSRGFLPGIDIRSDGGYVVAPPSDGYYWTTNFSIAQADDTVYDFLQKKERTQFFELPDVIPEGGRNDTLFKFASSMQAKGVPDDVIAQELERVNAEKCQPPLDDRDIGVIFNSVTGRYKKGKRKGAPDFPDKKYLKDGSTRIPVTVENTKALLEFKGYRVVYDVIMRQYMIHGEDGQPVRWMYESILTELSDYYVKIGTNCSNARIHEHINQIGDENRLNAVVQYLECTYMIYGDQAKGIGKLLDALGIADNELYSTLVTKWLCQCVAMAHNDQGAYGADGMLVLKGPQGIGKTTFFRKCCSVGLRYFTEGAIFDGTKDSRMIATSAWITELGELPRSMKDNDTMKAFITGKSDKYRVPYGKKEADFPRYTSLGATTNEDTFLKDNANRRYWVIELKSIDLEKLNSIVFEEVWAEAYTLYRNKNHESYRLTGEELRKMETYNNLYRVESEEERLLMDVFDWEQPREEWKEYTATQIAEIVGHNVSAAKIGKKIRSLKFVEVESRIKKGIALYKMPSRKMTSF